MKKILLTVGLSTAVIFGIQAQETPEKTEKQETSEEIIEARGNTEAEETYEAEDQVQRTGTEFASDNMTKITTSDLPQEVMESFEYSDFKEGSITEVYEVEGTALPQILESRANLSQYAGEQLPETLYMLHVDTEDGLGILYIGDDGEEIANELIVSPDSQERSMDKASYEAEEKIEETGEAMEQEAEKAEETVESAAYEAESEVEEASNEAEESVENALNEVEEAANETEQAVEAAAYETEEAVEKTTSETEETLENAASETENAVENAAYETEEAVEEAATEMEEATEATEETVESAAYEAESEMEEASNEAEESAENASNEVEEAANETEQAVEAAAYETEETVEESANEVEEATNEAQAEMKDEKAEVRDDEEKVLIAGVTTQEKLDALTSEFESKGMKKIASSELPKEVTDSFETSDFSEGTIEQAYEIDGAVLPDILESRANLSLYAGEQLPETLYLLHIDHEEGLSVLYIGDDGEVIASEDM